MLPIGTKVKIGSTFAKEHAYEHIVGEIAKVVEVYEHLPQSVGVKLLHQSRPTWYVMNEDLTPTGENNEDFLPLLNKGG